MFWNAGPEAHVLNPAEDLAQHLAILKDLVEKAMSNSIQILNASGQTLLSDIKHLMYWNPWIYLLAPGKDGGILMLVDMSKIHGKVQLFSNTFHFIWK